MEYYIGRVLFFHLIPDNLRNIVMYYPFSEPYAERFTTPILKVE